MKASPPRSSDHARRQRRRAALREAGAIAGLLAAAGVTYFALVLLPSQLRTRELRTRHDALAAEVAELRGRIASLRTETEALRSDPWAVERSIRGRLGYLRPGERVFRR